MVGLSSTTHGYMYTNECIGLDIDWEWVSPPASPMPALTFLRRCRYPKDASEAHNLVLLLQETRAVSLETKAMLSYLT